MGALRDRMDGDLRLRGYAAGTRSEYLRSVYQVVAFSRRSPTALGAEEAPPPQPTAVKLHPQRHLVSLGPSKPLRVRPPSTHAEHLRPIRDYSRFMWRCVSTPRPYRRLEGLGGHWRASF